MKTLVMIFILFIPTALLADNESITVRSVGKLISNDQINLSDQIAFQTELKSDKNSDSNDIESRENRSSRATAYHPSSVQFSIFDAWINISGDQDQDGYYHNIKVSFDADVDIDADETVYAKIYLSEGGSHWFQIATTDLFEIHHNREDDSYEIMTELIEGFTPGYYDVLIELHSLYHLGIVSQRVVTLDRNGYLISLEDLSYDEPDYGYIEYDSIEYGVSGSFSAAGLILLSLLLSAKQIKSRRK